MPKKKYIVRLSDEERLECHRVIKKLVGTGEKVKRAQVLLKADADGPNWTDTRIAEAFNCRRSTVEDIRKRLVLNGFQETLDRKKRTEPPRKKLDGEQEARIIALRMGDPPSGYGAWTLRLLAKRAVELEIVDSVSHETIRGMLQKTA